MILRDQVRRQGSMIVRLGFVEQGDAVAHLLAREKNQNVFLVGRSDAEAIQLEIVSKEKFQILECQKGRCVQLLGHKRIEFLCESGLDALGAAGLRLNKTLEFVVVDPVEQ